MINRYPSYRAALVLFLAALPSFPQQVILDDKFADGNSQNQNLADNSVWLFNGRSTSVRTDQPGAVTLDVTATGGSSEAVWAYFTESGKPVRLGIGDKLSVSVTFSVNGFARNGQDIRWGVLDSLGTRNSNNLTGGHNDAVFIGDTGYGLQYYASGAGSPFVIGRRTALANQNMFNNFADFATISGSGATERQPLSDDTPYTLAYTIERLTATTTRLSAAVTGGTLANLNWSALENNPEPNTSFDYFAFRFAGANFATRITFTRLLVEYSPAAPVITSQPQPSALTVRVGSSVTMSVGASGSALNYQWKKDDEPVADNESATTPTLTLASVKLTDTGVYTAVVSNAGGSVASQPVTLTVSATPVAPPPAITVQPANTTIVLGGSGALTVQASGSGLFYQWFREGTLIPGATAAELRFNGAQVSDSGTYTVVVSNSSGSIASNAATLLVVSPMRSTSFAPTSGATGLCTDTLLTLSLDQPVRVGRSGRIRILKSDGSAADTIDLSASPQTRLNGGTAFTYFPVIASGNSATIYPHAPLPVNDTYTVVMEPGVLVDASGAPFLGIAAGAWKFTTRPAFPATPQGAVVAADGSGDYCTLQTAIDAAPTGRTEPYLITVRAGVYQEINYVPSNKPFLVIRGEDRDRTIIQYANNANLNAGNSRAMFGVDAPDFTLDNITLYNTTPRGGSQAEAFRGNNSRIFLNRVTLKSFQDTTFLQGVALVADSYLEGDVDFMWGNGRVFFQNCELKAVTSGGYYTQIRNGQGQNGNAYVNCQLTAADGVTGVYLSRIDPGVFPYSQVVFIDCLMGPHIHPAGWLLNNATRAPNVQFLEYNSTALDGAAMDVSQRLADSRRLTETEAMQWRDPGTFLGWVPFAITPAATSAAPGATVNVGFSAAIGHNGRDWIGIYEAGAEDDQPIAWQYTGTATRGQLTFATPLKPGKYEFRYFLNDGYTRMFVSPVVTVQ